MTTSERPGTEPAEHSDADPAVPHVALPTVRGQPPAKVFATKNLAQRSLLTGKPNGTLRERLHGPLVKWPRNTTRKTPTAANAPASPGTATEAKGENMSERFISERLLSDRGPGFNPQIPRRVPDIPSPASVKASEADTDGKRLIVGKQVVLTGEVGGCDRLIVEGKVEATLRDVKILEIGANGTFKGAAAIESATIAGSFEGTLNVSGHLDIGTGAVVKGTVSYGTITVASGGKLLGTVEST
jgi:cytoskeletal protein CcmA (bactofilin family)